MKKSYTLCDNENCPLKGSCARYLPNIDKSNTNHFDPYPYNAERNKCGFYVQLDLDEILEKVNQILRPFNN